MAHRLLAAFLFACLSFASAATSAAQVKIATFNIQDFGKTKVGHADILTYLGQLFRKFDIIAVQEVSDVSETAVATLLTEINKTGRHYAYVLSDRTGKQADDHSSQEQYAFFFDSDRVEEMGDGLFDDHANDLFQREPFTAQFGIKGTTFELTATTIHTSPEQAIEEIGSLSEVYSSVVQKYPDDTRHLILGDFNGSCDYATPAQLDVLDIRQPPFHWIVPDSADTNLNPNRRCAYDRMVVDGDLFDDLRAWGIANWFTDKRISDHWPVWVAFSADGGH